MLRLFLPPNLAAAAPRDAIAVRVELDLLPGDRPGQTPAGQQAGTVSTDDLMNGVDTTWARYPGGVEIGELTAAALAQFKTDDPAASVPALLALRTKLIAVPSDPLVTDKLD